MSQNDEYETIPITLVNRDGSVFMGQQAPGSRKLTWRDYAPSVFLLLLSGCMIVKFIYDLLTQPMV